MTELADPMRVEVDARADFCAEHLRPLTRALDLFVRDASLGEELAQEVLLRACERWDEVVRLDRPAAWLYRVGTNLARSRARRARSLARALGRHGPSPTLEVPATDDALAMREALGRLPRAQREALVLRHVAGLTVVETAEALGVPESTITTRTSRGAAALRRELEDR